MAQLVKPSKTVLVQWLFWLYRISKTVKKWSDGEGEKKQKNKRVNWLKFHFWPCWMAPVVNHRGSFVMRSEWEIWNLLTCKLRFSFPNTHTCSLTPPPPQLSKPPTYMHSWTFTFGSICKSYSTSHNLNVKPLLFPNYTGSFFFSIKLVTSYIPNECGFISLPLF